MMRRIPQFALITVVAVVLGAALSPYWLGAILPTVAKRLGAEYATYSRVGYSRFSLNDVTVRRPGVEVHVERVEADSPLLWSIRHLTRKDQPITATTWRVRVVDRPPSPGPREASGWVPLHGQLRRIASDLQEWLPHANLGSGTVEWPGETLNFGAVRWESRTLHVDALEWKTERAEVTVAFPAERDAVDAQMNFSNRPLRIAVRSEDARITGTLSLFGQVAPVSAAFAPSGWTPTSAEVTADNWTLAGEDLRLAEAYARLNGSVHVAWKSEAFDVAADVRGVPVEKSGAPELHVIARAAGTPQHYRVDQFDITAPGVDAKLSAPFDSTLREADPSRVPKFLARVDLAALPWRTGARGEAMFQIEVDPRSSSSPRLGFSAKADPVEVASWTLTAAEVTGALEWPRLTLESATFTSTEDTRLTISGAADFAKHTLEEVRAQGRMSEAMVKPWLPAAVTFAAADVALKASGPWTAFQHEGTVAVRRLHLPKIASAAARIWWTGTGLAFDQAEAGIQAANTEVVLAGSASLQGAKLKKLVWRQAGQDRLLLEHDANLTWEPTLSVDAFDLAGPAGELRLTANWNRPGLVKFFARGIAEEWWRDFVPETPFGWSIDTFALSAEWADGPVKWDSEGKLSLRVAGRNQIEVDFAAKGAESNLTVQRLSALEGGKEFAAFQGALPVEVWAAPSPRVEFDRKQEFRLDGRVDPEARWWRELGEKTGVRLIRPNLVLALHGTVEEPSGTATFKVDSLELDPRLNPEKWPKVETLNLALTADKTKVRIDPLTAKIQGQPIALSAAMPWNPEIWEKLKTSPLEVAKDSLELSLRATDTDIAALAPFASGMLQPQGRMDADLTLSLRGPWKGYLRLHDLATRPIGGLGPLREVQADLVLQDRNVQLRKVQASLGGQPVSITGAVTIPGEGQPTFDVSAKGTNLPFARQAGLVVRGDVDVQLRSVRERLPPLVSGTVTLHDGLFLSDVRSLVPRGGAGAERRPPYFSITTPPFDRWRLEMSVEGERFLRARTPLFNGTASLKFRLLGTLAEPRAIGEVRIDDGQVMFPFATFALGDASVRLTEENPYEPQLQVFGSSQRYGYDLKLELTGAASAPQLTFSSNPPLSSEQVLLIVMAGETPKNEVTYSTSQRFARLGTYFGQTLLNSLGSGGGGSDRLTISSGERISRQGRETYDVEYKLGDRWTAVGEYDEFDEYNAGLKWRALPRKLRGEDNEKR